MAHATSDPVFTFTGSSALGGIGLDDDDDHDQVVGPEIRLNASSPSSYHQQPTLGLPTAIRRAPSPRGFPSAATVGTIGGHRSPAAGAASAVHTRSPLLRQTSDDVTAAIGSARPTSPFALGLRDSSPSSVFHAFRTASPSLFSAVSSHQQQQQQQQHQQQQPQGNTNGPISPSEVVNVPPTSSSQHTSTTAPVPLRSSTSSSSLSADRPPSRLDFGLLQQRSNAAAAAAAAIAATAGQGNDGRSASLDAVGRSGPAATATSSQPTTPRLVYPTATFGHSPELIQPRAAVPHRAFSADSSSGISIVADELSPRSPTGLSSTFNGLAVKPDGYPFPPPHVDRMNNSSRASNRVSQGLAIGGGRQSPAPSHFRNSQRNNNGSSPDGPKGESRARLAAIEAAVDHLAKGLTTVADNVAVLMEREKQRDRERHQGLPPRESQDIVNLSQQLAGLTESIQHLISVQRQPLSPAYLQQQQHQQGPLSLGFSSGPNSPLPHQTSMTSPGMLPSNMGARAISPRPLDSRQQGWSQGSHYDSRLFNGSLTTTGAAGPERRRIPSSQHPGQSGQANKRDSMPPRLASSATGSVASAPSSSTMNPEAGPAVTKWEHLNLQEDLLRAVLKYGLGPPNKVQQRALPFLLLGTDIIAQAPPTQERIASYVIPALNLVLSTLRSPPLVGTTAAHSAGPFVLMLSTTVDQATQAQRMAIGLGGSLGVRVQIAAAASVDPLAEAHKVVQHRPHIVVGTPSKMVELFTCLATMQSTGGPNLADVKLCVIDECDQLIARNLSDHVSQLLRVLTAASLASTDGGIRRAASPGPRPFGSHEARSQRQTAIFSNTVPQDVLNFAQSIHLRESVRVLVRREGTFVTQHPPSTHYLTTQPSSNSSGRVSPSPAAMQGHPGLLSQSPRDGGLSSLRQYFLSVAIQDRRGDETKVDLACDVLEDIEFNQAVVYTSSIAALEAVTYKLAARGLEALPLHREMDPKTRQRVLTSYRSPLSSFAGREAMRSKKILVVFDVALQPNEVHQVPLVLFYDVPTALDEYKAKVACAMGGGPARPSVCINMVTRSSDVEVLKSLESLGNRMLDLPLHPRDLLNG